MNQLLLVCFFIFIINIAHVHCFRSLHRSLGAFKRIDPQIIWRKELKNVFSSSCSIDTVYNPPREGNWKWWQRAADQVHKCIQSSRFKLKYDSFLGQQHQQRFQLRRGLMLISSLMMPFIMKLPKGMASAWTATSSGQSSLPFSPLQRLILWAAMVVFCGLMHSGECAMTKLSPYKVKEYAEEGGPQSPFVMLRDDITKLLITMLLLTTATSIYSTAIFFQAVTELFPNINMGLATVGLTVVELFIMELLPKAVAVGNAEIVTRRVLPVVALITKLFSPVTAVITAFNGMLLRLSGLANSEVNSVSEDMLRMVVEEAERSEEGIETGEGRMIKAVLDMQDQAVSKIMQPRVDMVALPVEASAEEILKIAVKTMYSRIPVYEGDIDNVLGIVFSKDLLGYMQMKPSDSSDVGDDDENEAVRDRRLKYAVTATAKTGKTRGPVSQQKKIRSQMKLKENWDTLTAGHLMEPVNFIPESMTCGVALQDMKKRRSHMMIVVDEYGGTAGLVTFEDILEEVVGEIYDEDDLEEVKYDRETISREPDGTFNLKGYASLKDVCEALDIDPDEIEESGWSESSTIGGLLCALVGHIPVNGEVIQFAQYRFTITQIVDERRILDVTAEHVNNAGNDAESLDEIYSEDGGSTFLKILQVHSLENDQTDNNEVVTTTDDAASDSEIVNTLPSASTSVVTNNSEDVNMEGSSSADVTSNAVDNEAIDWSVNLIRNPDDFVVDNDVASGINATLEAAALKGMAANVTEREVLNISSSDSKSSSATMTVNIGAEESATALEEELTLQSLDESDELSQGPKMIFLDGEWVEYKEHWEFDDIYDSQEDGTANEKRSNENPAHNSELLVSFPWNQTNKTESSDTIEASMRADGNDTSAGKMYFSDGEWINPIDGSVASPQNPDGESK